MNDVDDRIRPDIHSSSDEYRNRFSGAIGKWFLEKQKQITLDLLSIHQQGVTVVDFGGGHAQNIEPCRRLNAKLTILSSDRQCEKYLASVTNIKLVESRIGGLTKSGLETGKYTVAMSYRMLPHLDDWQQHIAELCRVSHSTVLIEFPNARSVNALADNFFKAKKKIEGNTRQFDLFDLQQVAAEFERHGFELDCQRGQYLAPMALYRAIGSVAIAKVIESALSFLLPKNRWGSPLICRFSRQAVVDKNIKHNGQ